MAFCFPISIAASSITFFPLIGLYLLGSYWTFRYWPPSWGRIETLFAVFWGLSVVSAWHGVDPLHSRIRLSKDLYFPLVILLGAYLRKQPHLTPRLLRALLWGGLVTAAFGVIQKGIGISQATDTGDALLYVPAVMTHWPHSILKLFCLSGGRSTGFRSHPITYGETLLFPLAYLLSGLSVRSDKLSWKWILSVGILLLALVLSQSRGPWIAFGVMSLTLALLAPRLPVMKGLSAVLILPVLLLLTVPSLRHRLHTIGEAHYESNNERVVMWKAGHHMFKDHPLLGVGPGNVRLVSAQYQTPEQHQLYGDWGHLHNTYINFAAERGVLGLIAFLCFIAGLGSTLYLSLRQIPDHDNDRRVVLMTGLLALIGWLVCGLTESVYNDTAVLMVFYLVMGMALARARNSYWRT